VARHAHHYLAIFDRGQALALYHAKRLASPGQRIVLYAKDADARARVATCPGIGPKSTMSRSGRLRIAPTSTRSPWPADRVTTRKRKHGTTEWIPSHLDYGQPKTNTFQHPKNLLADGDDEHEP
jgi:hypothetical protein